MKNLTKLLRNILPIFVVALFIVSFFRPLLLEGKFPIPADTIVGMYHPWIDLYSSNYPNGIPIKNSLITDAVRQQYPWRWLGVEQIKNGQSPTWNPYSFAGYPLIANIQSAVFYPLNALFLINNFPVVWTFQVLLQSILGALYMYLFLKNLNLRMPAIVLGVLTWIGCGFFVSWFETNTVIQTAIWLPLGLLLIDKKKSLGLLSVLFISLLAGHTQTFFYILLTMLTYAFYRKYWKVIPVVVIFMGIIAIFYQPVFQFINFSARSLDQANWQRVDWFIPWQQLIQFISPDFFGNPTTGNYFGVWNYGEFIGYVGILPLIFSLHLKSKFFSAMVFIGLLMALPNIISSIPFMLNFPIVSTFQPSRLLVVVDFSLAVLAAYGFDAYLNKPNKKPLVNALILLFTAFVSAVVAYRSGQIISLRNLILPSLIIILSIIILIKNNKFFTILILLLVIFDLSYFSNKFLSFSSREYLFPQTKVIDFLQAKTKEENFRIAPIDERIMPGNFSNVYMLQSISGYDPLYLTNYAEFIAAMERGKPDINPPFGYNRIITPKNINSPLFKLLNVRYVLSIDSISDPKYTPVYSEGETKIYEDTNYFPRAFFVEQTINSVSKQENIEKVFNTNLRKDAVVLGFGDHTFNVGEAKIINYSPNEVIITTNNTSDGFLVLLDIYYPAWKAYIDGNEVKIFPTDYTFRGVLVPVGKHVVDFKL